MTAGRGTGLRVGFRSGLRLVSVVAAALSLLAFGQGENDPGTGSVPAARKADKVAVITIRGEINNVTELSVKRRIAQAEASGADAMVFEIDSPGGEVGAVLAISNAIKASSIDNTVAWVNPDAYSGGAILALACREIVTSDPASMGDALPITLGPEGIRGLRPDERKKFLPPLMSNVTDSAARSGWDPFLVQAMIIDQIELWAVRDKETGRLYTINEDEYLALFGGLPELLTADGEPLRGKPIIPTVGESGGDLPDAPAPPETKAGEDGTPASQQADAADEAAPSGETGPIDTLESPLGPVADPLGGGLVDPGSSGGRFVPADESLADLIEDVELALERSAERPDFVRGESAQNWELVGYVADGTGPIVLDQDRMAFFGFSSEVIENDEELKAFFAASELARSDRSWSEHLVAWLTQLPVRGLLVVIFVLALFIEMVSPGMVLPAGVAVVAMVALIAPPMLIGMAGWWEIVAIVLGIGLLLVELIVLPGFGVFGVLGLLGVFAGLVGTFIPNSGDQLFPTSGAAGTQLLYGLTTVVLAFFTSGVGIYFIAKHFGTLPVLNRLVLSSGSADEDEAGSLFAAAAPEVDDVVTPGAIVRTITPLRPSGEIEADDGSVHDAVAEMGYVETGRSVRVVERRGFAWVVSTDLAGVHPAGVDRPTDHAPPEGGAPA